MDTKSNTCIFCRTNFQGDNHKVVDLGEIYPSTFVDKPEDCLQMAKADLSLTKCPACDFVQLNKVLPPDTMYRNYWYRSDLNASMAVALKDVVFETLKRMRRWPKNVLDIGCNDGTLLGFYPNDVWRCGFDPALNLNTKNCELFVNDYFNGVDERIAGKKFDMITAIAMFYDLVDPYQFLEGIKKYLSDDGIFVIQMTDLTCTFKVNAFDNVCLHPDELIVTENGLKPISEVKVHDMVLSHTGKYQQVKTVFVNKHDDNLLKLKAYGFGFDTIVTKNHPIAVKKDGNIIFKAASEIKIGDIVCKPIISENEDIDTYQDIKVNNDLMKIIGYYLSEGSINSKNNSVVFYFGKHEDELIEDCKNSIINLGFKANLYESKTSKFVVSYGKIVKFLESNFNHGASKKKISSWVLKLPADKLKTLLLSYMYGDGYEYRDGKYLRGITTSQQLAFDISLVANKLGWKCCLNKGSKLRSRTYQGRTIKQNHLLWDILIHTKPVKKMKTWIEDGYQLSRIKKIEEVEYSGDVYNIEVENDNTFVCPGMTTHNCHEHIAYWTLDHLQRILTLFDLEVFDVIYNNVNGRSIRAYICHKGIYPRTENLQWAEDNEDYVMSNDPFEHLNAFIDYLNTRLTETLEKLNRENRKVFALGASTKGNTLLQVFNIKPAYVPYCLEVSKDKFGKYTVGSNLLIVSEEEGFALRPDYLLLLPWHFADNIISKKQEYMKAGGQFIVPMPEPKVINFQNQEGAYLL